MAKVKLESDYFIKLYEVIDESFLPNGEKKQLLDFLNMKIKQAQEIEGESNAG